MSRRNVLLLAVLVLAVAAAIVVYANNNNRASAAATNVQTAQVQRGALVATVNGAGPVAARAQVMLNFGQAGTVKQIYVQLGDRVKQGQVLAELDATDLQLALANAQVAMNQAQAKYDQTRAGPLPSDIASAQASVDSAQAAYDAAVKKANVNDQQLVVARASLDKATIALQKAQSDYDTAVAEAKPSDQLTTLAAALAQSKIDYSSAVANYNIQVASINDSSVRSAAAQLSNAKANLAKLQGTPTQADLQIAEAQLEQAKISLQQAQYKLRNAQIIAPFDGVVTQVNIDNFFSVGQTSNAIQLSDLSKLQVTVNMAEVDIGKIKAGQDVNISFDALPDRPTLTGKVDQIALVGTTTQGVVNYPVVVTLGAPDATVIKTGMTANVAIVVDKRDNVLLVPNRAVRTQGRNRVVTVQLALGTTITPVTIGLQSDTQSEVVSGLKEGDVVVITTTPSSNTPNRGFPGGGGGPVILPGPRGD